MRILVIGGTRFMGYHLVWRLLAAGHRVTVLNRGQSPDPFSNRVARIHVDRRSDEFSLAVRQQNFDAVVDFLGYNANDAQRVVDALRDCTGHYLFISSGAAYLARAGAKVPCSQSLTEDDYPGPLSLQPTTAEDLASWRYGAGKRAAETVLMDAYATSHFPVTILRLPIVNGERDPDRRMESYLWRIIDGGPVWIPDAKTTLVRHVYYADVIRTIAGLVGRTDIFGESFNLSQDEEISLNALIRLLAEAVGAPDRTEDIAPESLIQAGLIPRSVSPFSGRWASRLNPDRAKRRLGFWHRPLAQYLDSMVASLMSHPYPDPPESYQTRATEMQLGHSIL